MMSADLLYTAVRTVCQETQGVTSSDVDQRITSLSDNIIMLLGLVAIILTLNAYLFDNWQNKLREELNALRVEIRDLKTADRTLEGKINSTAGKIDHSKARVEKIVKELGELATHAELGLGRLTINLTTEIEQRVDLDARVFTLADQVGNLEQFKDALQKTMGGALLIGSERSDTDSSTSETELASSK